MAAIGVFDAFLQIASQLDETNGVVWIEEDVRVEARVLCDHDGVRSQSGQYFRRCRQHANSKQSSLRARAGLRVTKGMRMTQLVRE